MHVLRLTLPVAALLGMATAALAQTGSGGTISEGDVFYRQGDFATSATSTTIASADYRVNGATGTDHLFANSWHYRIGGGTRENIFNNRTASTYTGDTGTVTFTTPEFSAVLTLSVDDTGTDSGRLTQSMQITNTSPAALSISLFYYFDYDMRATSTADSALLLGPNLIRVYEYPTTGVPAEADIEGIGADAYAVAAFGATPTIRGQLTDAALTNFTSTGLPFGPGDFTGAFQWNRTIDIGQSVTVTMVSNLALVPEPAGLTLLALGALGLLRRR